MTTLYKLMNEHDQTKNKTQWGTGVTVAIPPEERGSRMCKKGILHAYTSPLQAVLFQPMHGEAKYYTRLRRAEGVIVAKDVDKVGCHVLTTYELVDLPKITVEQRVEIAIRCVKELPGLPDKWVEWADKWLSGEDRTERAARAARAAWTAWAAAADARAAAAAAADAAAARAAGAAAAVATAADAAAEAVAWAVAWAGVDVMAIAEKVLQKN